MLKVTMPISSTIRASIIIPTYNRNELLINTVKHFLQQLTGQDEIIIIDQSDKPSENVRKLPNFDNRVTYRHISEKGLPNARNVGIEVAKGEIIIFSDDDVIPENGFVEAHVGAYQDPIVGAVAGRVIIPGAKQDDPAEFGTIRKYDYCIKGNFRSLKRKYVDHGQGCNISISRNLINKGVCSDKRFGGTAHLEETDLSLQVRKKGYKILYEPDAALIHLIEEKGGCRAADMEEWLYWYGHNYMLLFLKHGKKKYFPFFLLRRMGNLLCNSFKYRSPKILLKGIRGMFDAIKLFSNG